MSRTLRFSGFAARLQYHLLMGLFRLAVTRGLYGRFARGLGHIFRPGNAVYVSEGQDLPPFKIYLSDGYWTRFALYHHAYEPEIARILRAAAGATPLFCDLGANKGYWTIRAAPLFDTVIAVEASAATFRDLGENASGLPGVTLRHAAIHSTTGNLLSFINIHNSHASARLGDDENPGDTSEYVSTLRIDDIVPPGTPALIKLDVEGAEIPAFCGGQRALTDGSVMIYEDHGSDAASAPTTHLLSDPENRVYFCADHLVAITDPAQLDALKTDRYKGYNLVAARADSPLLASILEHFAVS